jgi:hypothetical protein
MFFFSWFSSFLIQFFEKEENVFEVGGALPRVTNDTRFINNHCSPAKDRLSLRLDIHTDTQEGSDIRKQRKSQIKALGKIFESHDVISTDAQDPGVEAVIEVEIPLMALHLARSDGGEGRWEEGDN